MEPSLVALISAGSAAVTALVAIVSLWGVRRDSAAQTRPYVQLKLDLGIGGPHSADLIVLNTGKSAAADLVIEGVVPEAGFEEATSTRAAVQEMFETSRTLPPGASLRCFWVVNGPSYKPKPGKEVTKLTACYRGSRCWWRLWTRRKYRDEFDIDTRILTSSPGAWDGGKVRGNNYATIAKTIGALTQAVNMTRWHN
jgi:hypothetical protein